ncbi:MAG TPA: MarP family serine protease [Candidatus Acidoferrales bacterium]|nr:MarP family serine protease [Candidatus Acidoferrales bacterium]
MVVVVLIGASNGYRRGLWTSLAQYVGLLGGVVAGAAAAPSLLRLVGLDQGAIRPLIATAIVLVAGSLGSSIGFWLGDPLHRALSGSGRSRLEMTGGAVFSGVMVLGASWFLAVTFDRGPVSVVAAQIQSSLIVRQIDAIFPRPPSWLNQVQQVLAGGVPSVFAGLEPQLGSLPTPASIDTSGVAAAGRQVYRVEGRGCGGIVTGSAYPVAADYLVTNAHVVSGTTGTTVTRGLGSFRAEVVLFDPENDVAVLWVPGLGASPLHQGQAQRGTQGATIGYPGGGPESSSPAVVTALTPARGRDIYNQRLVTRQIVVFDSNVRPGNSGGPLIDLRGHVLGIVFAASTSNPGQAYALSDTQIQPDLNAGVGGRQAVNTADRACAA